MVDTFLTGCTDFLSVKSVQRIHQHKITICQDSLFNFSQTIGIFTTQFWEYFFINRIQQSEK
jgi:hypothetical protein